MTENGETQVEDYANSFNTTVSYIHYTLSFPNDRVNLSLSGNYILEVYPDGKQEEPAITQSFIVTEDATKIDITINRPQMAKENNTHHHVGCISNYNALTVSDSSRKLFVFILQKGRWDNSNRN